MTVRQISYRLKSDGKAELQRDAKEVGDALENAGNRGSEAFERTGRILQNTGELTDRQVAKYKKLAQAAQEAARAEEAQAKFNAQLGGGSGRSWSASDFMTHEELGGRSPLSKGQRAGRLNLVRQGADVFTTGAMGMDPMMIAIQQGPQIIDAMAQAGIRATPAMLALGGTVVALGGSVVALTAAGMQYEAQQNRIDAATSGLGRTLQMTSDQFRQTAEASAEAGEISVKAATDAGIAYVATGKISGEVIGGLIALTRRYALTTAQDIGAATGDLAKHFSAGSQGVEDLNDKLHFLDAAELKHIQNLIDSGRETEGQKLAVDRLSQSLSDVQSLSAGWDDVLQRIGNRAIDVWEKVGRAISLAMGGGSDMDQLQTLLDKRSQAVLEKRSTLFYFGKPIEDFDREIAEVRDRITRTANINARAFTNLRDNERQGIVDKYADPNIKKLQDKQNERAFYLSRGGKEGDGTIKAIDAEIDALKAGYSSAAEQARKLEEAHDKAVRAGQKAGREKAAEARKTKRELEEEARLETARADHVLDNQRRIAAASGDETTIRELERQAREQQEINRWVREGLSLEQARVNVRAQMGAEMQAESDALRKRFTNPEGFVSSEDTAKALSSLTIDKRGWFDDYAETIRVSTGGAFHDGLMAGMNGDSFWDAFASRLKYAAASGLADSLTSSLFGSRDGKKTGWISTLLKSLPKHGDGTNFAPGGLSLVGEYGPEIVDLPRGSRVHTAGSTQAMVQNLAQRAAGASGGEVVNFHYSPTFHLQGTADEIKALRGEIAEDRRNFKSNAVAAYADARARRQIS